MEGKYTYSPQVSEKVSKTFSNYNPLEQQLLFSRGITTKKAAEKFLKPDWERDTFDPFGIYGMERAVERIFQAIEENETITVYSDFDCDGIPGGALLHDFFTKIGYEHFDNYIPHRFEEGFGFHPEAVEKLAEEGTNLIITLDVGIAGFEGADKAKELGVEVIVTDHHLPTKENGKEKLPDVFAVLDSKQEKDTYEDDMLSGAGVAFKLVQAMLAEGRKKEKFSDIPEGWEKWLLDMAGLSTVCDMVPLRGENRALAYFGLQVMRRSRRKGLMALLQKTNVSQKDITEDDLGFMVGPRINAASRIDHPLRAFELLTASDDAQAIQLANYLDGINDKRKGVVASMIKESLHKLRAREVHEVAVIGNPSWHPGLLGLAATKLVEHYNRPVFTWGRDSSGLIRGSCRSDGSVSLVELMREAPPETFLQFGGHDGAGGFSLRTDNVHTLEAVLSEAYNTMEKTMSEGDLLVDGELSLDDVNWETQALVDQFAPFGMANPKPQFLFKNVVLDGVRKFGRNREHLEVAFRNSEGKRIPAICFFAPSEYMDGGLVAKGNQVDLVATLEKSNYRKYPELRLRVVGIFDTEA